MVSTNAAGIKEVIRDGQDGFYVQSDNPEMLVVHMMDLLKNKARREALVTQAWSRVITAFSMRKIVTELQNT